MKLKWNGAAAAAHDWKEMENYGMIATDKPTTKQLNEWTLRWLRVSGFIYILHRIFS